MAEGPLVHSVARDLRRVLKGKRVRVTFGPKHLKVLKRTYRDAMVRDVEAYGKQFRIIFEDKTLILVHLMMWGWWRIYRKGRPWDRPRERARVVLATSTDQAVAFSAPVVKVFTEQDLRRDPTWGDLGPDPLRRDFSAGEYTRRLELQGRREIGDVILDQKVLSGVGNIIKIEALFGAGIHPRRQVFSLTPSERERLLGWIFKLMHRWMKERGNEDQWMRIYRKSSKGCPKCGGTVERFRQGGRITYACPSCQPLRKSRRARPGSRHRVGRRAETSNKEHTKGGLGMGIGNYIGTKKGYGVLATADSKGKVNVAYYAKPYVTGEKTVALIMADRLTLANLRSNPKAAYIFIEAGKAFAGIRLHLTKTREERAGDIKNSALKRSFDQASRRYSGEKLTLVHFRVNKVLPIIGG